MRRDEARMIAEELAKVLCTPTEDKFMSVDECAAYIGVHRNTIARNTELPRVKFGGRVLYPKSKVTQYLLCKQS